ncbi:MAG: hypothetical protein Q9165_007825 [Trypethelium subeluteriae]
MTKICPPYAFGHRLLAVTLSDLAASEPSRIYATIPKTNDVSDGFLDVTFSDMNRMVSALTGWIEDTWDRSSSFETIAYVGVPDLRSAAVFFAAVRSGYKVFLPSPRNPAEVNAALLNQTECSKIIYTGEVKPVVDKICKSTKASAIAVAPFQDLLRMDSRTNNSPEKAFEDAKNDPILILHSSGSTGLPKPVTMTNGTFAVLDSERFLPTTPGRVNRDFSIWDFQGGGKFFTIFPYFHLAGFLSLVINPVFTEASTPVIGPALAAPSGALMKEVLKQQKVKALYIPPSIAEQLLAESDGLDYFRALDFICYTGGPFSPDSGKKLVGVTDLVPLYGSTEAFQTPQLVASSEDWAFMEWNPHFKHEMQAAEDGAYELVLYTDSSTEKRSALNHNFPGVAEWRTRDLFKPHPSKANLWSYYGRRDDIIVFSNGEKFNPVPMELKIGSNAMLSGALVVGQGRTQALLLLEPKPDINSDSEAIKNSVWPLIERANMAAPAQGRVTRSNILVVPPGAFVRAGKGTIIRRLSEQKLQAEIDRLSINESHEAFLSYPSERTAIENFVSDVVAKAFSQGVGVHDDLFAFGLDSLKSTELVKNLKSGIKPYSSGKPLDWISLDLVYRHPSIGRIADILQRYLTSGAVIPAESIGDPQIVAAALAKFTKDLPELSDIIVDKDKTGLTIALTGSTGSLGNALLQRLSVESKVKRIYCLNRRRDSAHEAKYSSVHFLQANTHASQLGLKDAEYQSLQSEVDIIIHNAWQVNFSLPFQAFEDQLQGLHNLIDWSLRSPRRPRLVFCSSVSSVMDWPLKNPESPIIPEDQVGSHSSALQTGYGISKSVAEQMLSAGSQQGADIVIIRFGQIVQPGDFSSKQDGMGRSWVPALFKTSKTLGCFPVDICDIDWISLDEASASFLELSLHEIPESRESAGGLRVYNAVNGSSGAWADVVSQLAKASLTPDSSVALVTWVSRLETAISEHSEDLDTVLPCAKLLSFFRALGKGRAGLEYDKRCARHDSKTLRSLSAVNRDKIDTWMAL